MKKTLKYIFVLMSIAVSSCEKISNQHDNNEIPVTGDYIQFSSGVSVKAPIITSMNGKSFGVIGFKYPNYQSWTSARSLAKPDLCHRLEVLCNEYGVCTYDANNDPDDGNQYMLWDLLNNHTFFSYFPFEGTGISISGENKLNTPYIEYDMPFQSQPVHPDDLYDVMTGYAMDQTVRSGKVEFTFQHRLCCIDVVARNFNDEPQTISNISVDISKIQYNTVKIPMQKGDSQFDVEASVKTGTLVPDTIKFTIPSSESYVVEKNQTICLTGEVNKEKNIILIPQENHIEGKVHFKNNGIDESMDFKAEFSLEEGKKYSIIINFTGDDIIVLMVQAGLWDVVPVKYEFD